MTYLICERPHGCRLKFIPKEISEILKSNYKSPIKLWINQRRKKTLLKKFNAFIELVVSHKKISIKEIHQRKTRRHNTLEDVFLIFYWGCYKVVWRSRRQQLNEKLILKWHGLDTWRVIWSNFAWDFADVRLESLTILSLISHNRKNNHHIPIPWLISFSHQLFLYTDWQEEIRDVFCRLSLYVVNWFRLLTEYRQVLQKN